jgi:Lon protease-like protein
MVNLVPKLSRKQEERDRDQTRRISSTGTSAHIGVFGVYIQDRSNIRCAFDSWLHHRFFMKSKRPLEACRTRFSCLHEEAFATGAWACDPCYSDTMS